jgi:hypothetical protein
MDYHLVCVQPFGKYAKGQVVTDPDEWAKLADDHEHRFVRIAIPAAAEPVVEEPAAEVPSKRAIPRVS